MRMTSAMKFICMAFPVVFSAGCAQSHRGAYAYTPDYYSTTPSTITLAPTSEYQEQRVYQAPSETIVTTTPVVTAPAPIVVTETPRGAVGDSPSASDLVLAGDIRRMISENNDLVTAARNTRISIYNGQVTVTGTTATRDERERLHAALQSVPGIIKLNDRVRATLEGSYP